jgi:DNA-binding GntR family transcriptional regulator
MPLAEEVANHLRDRIMSGDLLPGSRLRLEHVAGDLKISVTPVREALVTLRGEGFVHSQPRRGFVVAPMTRQDVADIFTVQADLAGELCARAAKVITDEQLTRLEVLQEQLAALDGADEPDKQEALNSRWHSMINTMSGSSKLLWFFRTAVRYAPLSFFGDIEGWGHASNVDHLAVLNAMRARDPEAARRAMHRHFIHAGELLLFHLDKAGMFSEGDETAADRKRG